MARAWTRAAVALAVIGLAVAGCGDDDKEALTEEAFLEQGNAICAAGNERIDAQFEEQFPTEESFQDEEALADFKDVLEDDIDGQIDDLRDLEPPEELADDVEAMLDTADAALEDVRAQSIEDFTNEEVDPFAEVNELAGEIGLTECADDGEPEVGVAFASPADGDETTSPVHVEMTAEGITIEPAAEGVNEGAGHFHVIVDHGCVEPGETIPGTDGYNHFGQAQTEADLELTPGEHTLCLQVGDGAHTALDATDEITITVTG